MNSKLPISAVVITYNEAHLLKSCLSVLSFCNEIITIDLGSNDNSVDVCAPYTNKQLFQPLSFAVEPIRKWASTLTKNDWIMYIDPDEVLSQELSIEIINILSSIDEKVGMITVPWLFYFKRKALSGTFWGIDNMNKTILINRCKVKVPVGVHQGYILNEGFENKIISLKANNVLKHYWMNSYKKLYQKHLRHLEVEGKTKYNLGWRYNIKKQYKTFLTSFYDSYIIYKGWRDGFIGLFLSFFFAWYNFQIWSSLKKYQGNIENQKS